MSSTEIAYVLPDFSVWKQPDDSDEEKLYEVPISLRTPYGMRDTERAYGATRLQSWTNRCLPTYARAMRCPALE
eukprot:3679285-Rhodomonas_salina.1